MNEIKFPKIFMPLDEPYRYKVMHGGRGSAKSWSVARKLLILGASKDIRVLCTRELQKSIKQSVHKLLANQVHKMGLEDYYKVENDIIKGKRTNTEFIFLGVKHNTDEIRSTEGVTHCWIEEAHSLTESSWDVIEPTIRVEGSEIWVTYNPRFKFDHIHQLFVMNPPPPKSWVQQVNHDDNPYFPQVLQESMEHMKSQDYEKYLHVWEGRIRKLAEGAIFGKQIEAVDKEGRLLKIPITKNCEMFCFMDLGKNDETAIWFMQRVGQEYRFVDYFQGRLEEVEYYTRFIRFMPYIYGGHYLPHDASHERLGMPKNIQSQFSDAGVNPITIVPRISVKTAAINLARNHFPKCWFHKGDDLNREPEQCEGYYPHTDDDAMMTRTRRMEKGYEALCNYRYKYRDEDDVFHQSPHHDWSSNGADAFMQFAQSDFHTHQTSEFDDWSVAING